MLPSIFVILPLLRYREPPPPPPVLKVEVTSFAAAYFDNVNFYIIARAKHEQQYIFYHENNGHH